MQALPGGREDGFIDPVADKRMGEEVIFAFGPDQLMAQQLGAVVVRHLDQMAERRRREALAEDRGGLQGSLVLGLEPVHPGQHQALDRAGDQRRGALGHVLQQLLQEQGVPCGALQALRQPVRVGPGETGRHLPRLARAQRAEIDDADRLVKADRPPGALQRIALGPGRRHQRHRVLHRRRHHRRQAVERRGVGPVQILDQDQLRRTPARPGGQTGHQRPPSVAPGGVVHRIVERAQLQRLRQIEEVVDEDPLGLGEGPGGERLVGGAGTGLLGAGGGQTHQAAHQRRNRPLPLAGAEIQHQAAMHGEAGLARGAHCFLGQPRLADPGGPTQQDGLAFPGRRHLAEDRPALA